MAPNTLWGTRRGEHQQQRPSQKPRPEHEGKEPREAIATQVRSTERGPSPRIGNVQAVEEPHRDRKANEARDKEHGGDEQGAKEGKGEGGAKEEREEHRGPDPGEQNPVEDPTKALVKRQRAHRIETRHEVQHQHHEPDAHQRAQRANLGDEVASLSQGTHEPANGRVRDDKAKEVPEHPVEKVKTDEREELQLRDPADDEGFGS